MEPNSQFQSYPTIVRYWFETYTEARARLDRATNNTDIDSEVQDKASRARRKKKQLETDVESDKESSASSNVLRTYSSKKRKKDKNDNKKLKITSIELPTFSSLPVIRNPASSVCVSPASSACVSLSAPVCNKKLKVAKNKKVEGVHKTNVNTKVLSQNTPEKDFSHGQESLLDKSTSINTGLKEELYRGKKSVLNEEVSDGGISHNDDIPVSEKNREDYMSESSEDLFRETFEPNEDDNHFSHTSSEGEQSESSNSSLVNRNEINNPPEVDYTEANNDKGTSVIALFKEMFEKMKRIEQRQFKMENNVEEIKQLLLNRTEALKHPRNLPKLPLQTYDDSKYLEDKIKCDEAQKEYVIKRLCLAARGASDKECAKRVMQKLMSNHVGTKYSWQGSGGKKDSFKNTTMMEAVRHQKITEEVFPYLDSEIICILIPFVGERLLFNLKFKAEQKINELHIDTNAINAIERPSATVIATVETNGEVTVVREPTFHEDLNENDKALSHNKIKQVQSNSDLQIKKEEIIDRYDLESILKKYDKGLIVLQEYNINKKLSFMNRNYLAEIIVGHELRDDLDKRLSPERLDFISNKIIELFPTETKETYIDIDSSSGICNTGKGKLYNKWYNKRRQLAKLNLIPAGRKGKQKGRKRAREDDEIITVNEPSENDDTLLWLKNSSQPWSKVVDYWQQTWAQRMSELLTDGLGVGQYMAQYPALDNGKGYTLLEIDFEKRNPEKVLKLFVNWPKLSDFLFEKLRNKIKDFSTDIVSEDLKALKILTSVSHLFACVNARKQTKEIKEWRPSKIEMQEGFILHVKIIGDLEVQLRSRQEKLAQHNCDLQPLVAIIGPKLDEIYQSFVVLGVRKYFEVDTPLKAIDVCFKIFHALHTQYPPECAQIWQFIQRAAYEMPRNRQYDPHYSSVEILLKEFSSYHSITLE